MNHLFMHKNQELIQNFYKAFSERKADKMGEAYHSEATFNDPAFVNLKGRECYGMWAMLIEGMDPNGTIECKTCSADDSKGSADWEAVYKFSKTGRLVHNKIHAEFQFKDGKIIVHKDSFPFWKWSRMAMGMTGLFLGWTPMFQKKVQSEVAKTLAMYMKRRKIK